jgi:deazaflavin-dependent oxidoreductase (nitroreductase family)
VTLRAHLPGFNRRVINPIARTFAGRVPPFSLLEHVGRNSGTRYQTPIMSFPSGNDLLIALTYGPETDWVRNVVAAEGCSIEYRRTRIELIDPELLQCEPETLPLPWLVRKALGVMQVNDFLSLTWAQPLAASEPTSVDRPAENPG